MFASHVADADVERDREDEDRLDAAFVRSIGLVVRSNLFWSYSTMLTKLFGVLHDLMSWSESCACHEVHTPQGTERRWKQLWRSWVKIVRCGVAEPSTWHKGDGVTRWRVSERAP